MPWIEVLLFLTALAGYDEQGPSPRPEAQARDNRPANAKAQTKSPGPAQATAKKPAGTPPVDTAQSREKVDHDPTSSADRSRRCRRSNPYQGRDG